MAQQPRPARRQFLTSAGLLTGGLALGAAGGAGLRDRRRPAATERGKAVPSDASQGFGASQGFDGGHQPGVVDRPPAILRFLAFDLTPAAATRVGLRSALQLLSRTGRAVMAGSLPPEVAAIAAGLGPAGVTVSIGIGASGLSAAGLDVPPALRPLPSFPTDRLRPERSGGDLGVQLCGTDPLAVAVASRALIGSVPGLLRPRWSQGGFLRGSAATDPAATPRNLMGQLDGTDNPTGARQSLAVWVPSGVAPSWMAGGSYLVCRRIRMLLDSWEQLPTTAQEAVIGRRKTTGAPLSGHLEHDNPDFAAALDGQPVIAPNAHVRLAHPTSNAGATMLRRGYSYDDGIDAAGQPDSGLFFQAFQTDPHQVFVPIQRRLAATDALNSFIRHEASAVFALPAGASPGGYVGEALF